MNSNWITILGLVAATCTTISFLPQVVKIIKLKETRDISLWMYVILAAGVVLWLSYGILNKDLPLVIANSLTLTFTVIIIALKLKYG